MLYVIINLFFYFISILSTLQHSNIIKLEKKVKLNIINKTINNINLDMIKLRIS